MRFSCAYICNNWTGKDSGSLEPKKAIQYYILREVSVIGLRFVNFVILNFKSLLSL